MNRLFVTLVLVVAISGLSHAAQPRASWTPDRPLYGNSSYRPTLEPLLRSADASERARSAFLLGMIGKHDSAGALLTLLKDPERGVRVSAGLGLGFLGSEKGVHVCEAVLVANPGWLRYYAVYALWCMDSPRAKAVLKRNQRGQNEFITGVVRDALKTPFAAMKASPPSSSPKPEDLWGALCDMYITEGDRWWHRGDYNQTIRCHETAIFFDPTYVEGYSLIAWLQWSMGDDAAAIRTLNRGIEAMPEDPETFGALGEHYWITKRYDLALEPLRKSIELGGDHLVRRKYANALEKLGKIEESLAQWEEILKEVPDDGAAPLNIDRLKKLLAEP